MGSSIRVMRWINHTGRFYEQPRLEAYENVYLADHGKTKIEAEFRATMPPLPSSHASKTTMEHAIPQHPEHAGHGALGVIAAGVAYA
ncbi:hypothetical protein [Mesorhizobium sp. M0239]|uniref:hypothetical protein n=1 Tax=Mesorhizobium sp. M0239 TaxID=2956924 RepID=UPI003335FD4A